MKSVPVTVLSVPAGDSVNLTLSIGRNNVNLNDQTRSGDVVIGVDTHKHVHVAAVMQAGITLVHSVQMQNHLKKLVL